MHNSSPYISLLSTINTGERNERERKKREVRMDFFRGIRERVRFYYFCWNGQNNCKQIKLFDFRELGVQCPRRCHSSNHRAYRERSDTPPSSLPTLYSGFVCFLPSYFSRISHLPLTWINHFVRIYEQETRYSTNV